MNLFQLVFKQMRQRALSTWLTLLSVLLGVGLATSIMILRRGSAQLFVQSDFGYELILGAPQSSPLNLVLNTAYHMGVSGGTMPYQFYEDMIREFPAKNRPFFGRQVKVAVPFMVGDSYKGRRIVGTSGAMFGFEDDGSPISGYDDHGRLVKGFEDPDKRSQDRDSSKPLAAMAFEFRKGRKYVLAQGHCMRANRFEAVIGSDVATALQLKIFDDHLADAELETEAKKLGRALTADEKRQIVEQKNESQSRAFRATHGFPGPNEKPDIHKPIWHIVGILEQTHTANDRILFVPVVSLYAIEEHETGMISQAIARANIDPSRIAPGDWPQVLRQLGFDPLKVSPSVLKELKKVGLTTKPTSGPTSAPATNKTADDDEDAYKLTDDGEIIPELPKEEWRVNAILVRTRGGNTTGELFDAIRATHPEAQAVAPAPVMVEFFETFFKTSTQVLLIISLLVTIVAAVGILVSIYNSVAARMREIAILRALGATRGKVLTMICCEAGLVGLIGGICGLVAGHLIGALEAYYFNEWCGQTFDWISLGLHEPWYANEPLYLLFVVVVATLAGLVPAMKAYRSPVATNLVSG